MCDVVGVFCNDGQCERVIEEFECELLVIFFENECLKVLWFCVNG